MLSKLWQYLSITLALLGGALALIVKGQRTKLDNAKAETTKLNTEVATNRAARQLETAINKAAATAEAENKQAREQRNEEPVNADNLASRFGSADRLRD
jgi:hypothetical protein